MVVCFKLWVKYRIELPVKRREIGSIFFGENIFRVDSDAGRVAWLTSRLMDGG